MTATNKFVSSQGLLVEVISEKGAKGFGYADLFPRTGESVPSAQHVIERSLKPLIEGRDLAELGKIRLDMSRAIAGNPRAKSAVETALCDLLARLLHLPLYLLLGGLVKKEIKVIRLLGLSDPEGMTEEAVGLVRKGFTAFKVKLSGSLRLDLKRVSMIREAVGNDVFLKVDANESYDAKSAVHLAKKLADLGVEVFEQPVPRGHIEALREVKDRSPLKIEADQSVASAADAFLLIKNRVVDSINTSPQKAGGIWEAKMITELCALAGVNCVLGNIAGCMVGDAAALHVAASSPGASDFCELGEFEAIINDPFSGLSVEHGALKVPSKEGLGVIQSN